jgi:hypothetical protein
VSHCLYGVDLPESALPHVNAATQMLIEFLVCWQYEIAKLLTESEVCYATLQS